MAGWWGAVACLGRGSGRERAELGCSRSWEGCASLLGNQVTWESEGPGPRSENSGRGPPPSWSPRRLRRLQRAAPWGCSSVPDRPMRWLRGAGDAAFLSRSP